MEAARRPHFDAAENIRTRLNQRNLDVIKLMFKRLAKGNGRKVRGNKAFFSHKEVISKQV